MGCLLEFLIEFFFEGIIEGIIYVYMKLMTFILPEHTFSPMIRERLTIAIKTVSALLLVVLIIGIFLFLIDDETIQLVGQYMTFIPLAVIGVQVLAGIIVKIFRKRI